MKPCSTALATHLQQGQTTIAWIVKVKRSDGAIYGFTTHDQDVVYDNGDGDGAVTYLAKTALKASGEQNKSDLSVDNLEVTFLLDSSSIAEKDIRARLFDDAVIQVRILNWTDLTQGDVYMRKGTLGVVKMVNGLATAELRGLSYRLSTPIGATIGPICRAEFGAGLNGIDLNSKYLCKFDVTLVQATGHLTGIPDSRTMVFLYDTLPTDQPGIGGIPSAAGGTWYNDGVVQFTSGALSGQKFEIKTGAFRNPPTIVLYIPILGTLPSIGDEAILEAGCNKTIFDCQNKFNNIVNFRGEPFVPGMDTMMDYPDAT